MNRLIAELTRLYFLPGQEWQSWQDNDAGQLVYVAEGVLTADVLAESLASERNLGLALVSPNGLVRTMVIGFENGRCWEDVAALYQGVQIDLDLPAPAISVSVVDGYQIWFSLAEAVPLAQAQAFLNALRRKYLADIPLSKLKFRPGIDGGENVRSSDLLPLMQVLKEPDERWSAFIDPSMGSMFIDEPWLEMAPNLDKQGSMLAGVGSIKADDFQRAMSLMLSDPLIDADSGEGATCSATDRPVSWLGNEQHFTDPKVFLSAVMNDPLIRMQDRIEAAKALLPYFEEPKWK